MKQTNWTRMLNRKSTNTPLLLRNCASKNSLKTLFKVNAEAKISLNKGVFALFLLSIWVQFVCFIFVCFSRPQGCRKVSKISFLRSYMNQRKKTTLDSRLENSRAIKSNKKNYLENGFVYHRFLKSMSQYQSQYSIYRHCG